MAVRITQWTLDVHDVEVMSHFWSQALGYRVQREDDGSAHLCPPADAGADELTVWLQPSAGPKRAKNRNHPDLEPLDADADAEAERLIALGACHADVGQTEQDPFIVLADPEGNEFCVLRRAPRRA